MRVVEPQKEHQWLQKLVGEWSIEAEAMMGPDQPPVKSTGTESARSLGGLWVLSEGRGEMPGGAGMATTLLTLGYDPQKQKYVGTWVGSMMTYLWVYEGTVDAEGKRLTLDTEGPDFSGGEAGATARYRDVLEFLSDDHRVLSSQVLGPDGNWISFMTAHYRRKS